MTQNEKLEVLQGVANDVVNRGADLNVDLFVLVDVVKAIKALELVLVAIGARQEGSQTTTRTELSQPRASSEA